jgi:hypothetical protein
VLWFIASNWWKGHIKHTIIIHLCIIYNITRLWYLVKSKLMIKYQITKEQITRQDGYTFISNPEFFVMFLFWCYSNVYKNAKISLVLEKHAIEKHIWNEIFAQEYNKGGEFICPNENLQKRNNSFYECISCPNWVIKFVRPNTPSFISREIAIIKLFHLKMFHNNKIESYEYVDFWDTNRL